MPVWVQFTGPDRISEIGASVEVHVTIKFVPDAIVIPAAALFEDAERHNSYVFTVGADSRAHRTVVAIGIHPFVVGRPYRLRQLRRAFEHILRYRDRIWLTRPRDIYAHIASLPAGMVPGS